jgi:hypothetical protein
MFFSLELHKHPEIGNCQTKRRGGEKKICKKEREKKEEKK